MERLYADTYDLCKKDACHMKKCMDCGKVVSGWYAKRCRQCAQIERWKDPEAHKAVSKWAIENWKDPEYREATSKRLKERWKDDEYRTKMESMSQAMWDNDPNRKKEASERTKIWNSEQWADPIHRQVVSAHAKEQIAKQRSDPDDALWYGYAKRLRNEASAIELKFKECLDMANVSYVHQYKPVGYTIFYDFYLPDYHALIEIDSEFWHHSEWAKTHSRDAERDADKDKWACDNGYALVRIHENELCPTIIENWLLPRLSEHT